jgi:hypothetical protein
MMPNRYFSNTQHEIQYHPKVSGERELNDSPRRPRSQDSGTARGDRCAGSGGFKTKDWEAHWGPGLSQHTGSGPG